jgi:hypothetical protein
MLQLFIRKARDSINHLSRQIKVKGQKCPLNQHIREIDGASFYSLVTGDENALEDLFDVLPEVIKMCSNGKYIMKDKTKLKEFFFLAYK